MATGATTKPGIPPAALGVTPGDEAPSSPGGASALKHDAPCQGEVRDADLRFAAVELPARGFVISAQFKA